MFFSVNGPEFREAQPYLERFIRDKERRSLPSDLRVYTFYCIGKCARHSGVVGLLDTSGSGRSSTFSELAFPPFGYVMAFGRPPAARMEDISHFAEYGYGELRTLYLHIPVLPVIGYMPGDYRTEDEIAEAAELTEQETAEMRAELDDKRGGRLPDSPPM